MAFTYRPLDPARQEIRLLHLLPSGDFDAPLRCELHSATLLDVPSYEALSYTWGEPLFTQPIELNSCPFLITVNLEAALRHLRKQTETRVMWVDAICINQDDAPERSHQVTSMKVIYAQCVTDLAWLGPNPSEAQDETAREQLVARMADIHEGMDLMTKIKDKDIATLAAMKKEMDSKRHIFLRRTQKNSKGLGAWLLDYQQERKLHSLFNAPPLWARIWVMQELSCAPHVVLVAGHKTLDWSVLFDFLGDKPYADAFHVPGRHGLPFRMQSQTRQTFRHTEHIQHQRSIMKDAVTKGSVSKLMDVLARFKYAHSSDPRDKIYGLLGLVTEDHGVVIDYNKSVAEVYADVTESIINAAGNLDIMCQNPWLIPYSATRTPSLPSWVPDFAYDRAYMYEHQSPARLDTMLFAQRGTYTASTRPCETPCRVVRDGSGKYQLLLRGSIVDEIGPVLQKRYHVRHEDRHKPEFADPDVDKKTKLPERWMRLYYGGTTAPLDDQPSQTYPATGEPLFRAYARTLVLDCKGYPIKRLSPEDADADAETLATMVRKSVAGLNMVKRSNSDGQEWEAEDMDDLWRLRSRVMASRLWYEFAFSLSKTGLMMMLPRGAKYGDVIALVEGGKVPFLLRPVVSDGVVQYEYVDAVYVHGFMDGEAEKLVGEGKLEMRYLSIV